MLSKVVVLKASSLLLIQKQYLTSFALGRINVSALSLFVSRNQSSPTLSCDGLRSHLQPTRMKIEHASRSRRFDHQTVIPLAWHVMMTLLPYSKAT